MNSTRTPSSSTSLTFREFSLDEIKVATNNFDLLLLLRKGWTHELYEGTYEDHGGKQRKIIIKVFQTRSPLWNKDKNGWIEDQVFIWSHYHHKHVVSVLGYCHEFGENIVVYEHMVNGSLAQHLSKKREPTTCFYLSWEECLHICIDAARGIEYIHNTIRDSNGLEFIHPLVAVTNIMLDEDGVAKISDINFDFSTEVNDVPGFCFDPESRSTGLVNKSSDVYAFGVILVKVLSRKVSFDKEDMNLGTQLKKSIMDGTIHDRIIHPDMKAEIPPDCLTALVHIIGECLDSESKNRPSFSHLVKKLEVLLTSTSRQSCKVYSLLDIQTATNNFRTDILGQGGEGTVYKGVTDRVVAVKVLKPELSLGFEREIKMLSDLDHPNLVSLVGYCGDSDQKVLVYEVMSNGDLHKNLYRAVKPLTWMQRLNICIGAARGLRYLHSPNSNSRKGIIHRDIKPINILLDDNYNAKISDFGLSKMAPPDQASSEIQTMVKGTTGYYAPEYHRSGVITRRIDVFAFGVVLCEVLCRKRHDQRDCSFFPTEDEKYVQWAKENIDPYLKGLIDLICFEVFAGLMEKCVNVNPKRRPKMNEVVATLEYALKWQEAQERQKYGGDLCLPMGEDRVILYCKPKLRISATSQLHLRIHTRIVQVEVRDLENDLCVMELKHALGNAADISIPQLFLKGKHVGDLDKIRKLSRRRSLYRRFGLPPPQYMCDNCQKAKTCRPCQMREWYIHCNNCGALTLIWSKWETPLRSCNECNMNELTCNVFRLYL